MNPCDASDDAVVLEILRDGPRTPYELATQLRWNAMRAQRCVKRLFTSGQLAKRHRNYWVRSQRGEMQRRTHDAYFAIESTGRAL